MRVLITGMDGYLGWPLAVYLTAHGHEVAGLDNFTRRRCVAEMGSDSAVPIASIGERLLAFEEHFGTKPDFRVGDMQDYNFLRRFMTEFQPEAIVHLGQMPSAPYSMIDVHHAVWTQTNNVMGNLNLLFAIRDACPDAHLIKLGTMGEYGTPNVDIPEGFFEVEYRGRLEKLPFPRQAGSFYHQSKVHDSHNTLFACKIWGLRATDVMQGVVFGTRIDEMSDHPQLRTRLDFDESFGTAINRFACSAIISHPLTLFGNGHQKRGFLPLRDSMQCLKIAIENPPTEPEYRVFNQFEEVYSITELAAKVKKVGSRLGMEVEVRQLENPRTEMQEHHYNPDHQHLLDLGYQPTQDMEAELDIMLRDLLTHKERINRFRDVLVPSIRWDGERRKSQYVNK